MPDWCQRNTGGTRCFTLRCCWEIGERVRTYWKQNLQILTGQCGICSSPGAKVDDHESEKIGHGERCERPRNRTRGKSRETRIQVHDLFSLESRRNAAHPIIESVWMWGWLLLQRSQTNFMTATRCRERNKNPGLDAKAWLNGHIVQLRPDGFILQTRFYPHINIHLSEQTTVRCKKHILKTMIWKWTI